MSRVFYVSHDISQPRGGVRVLFRHVEHLRGAGIDARILHFGRRLDIRWFDVGVPVHGADAPALPDADDWVVLPEDFVAALRAFAGRPCRRAVLCQGHFNVFKVLAPEQSYRDFGVERLMGCSRAICEFARDVLGYDPVYVPNALDPSLYQPGALKQRRIACMPRKGPHNLQIARGILYHRRPDLRSVPWLPLEGMHERQVARALSESALFVATGYQEGFGMPALEAMAAGAVVVGFDGGGGKEYAHADNGYWVPNEDPLALARALEQALDALDAGDGEIAALRSRAREVAGGYGLERQRDALLAAWRPLLAAA